VLRPPGFPPGLVGFGLAAWLLILGSALSGCSSTGTTPASSAQPAPLPVSPQAPAATAPSVAASGKMRVALLLPLTGPSAALGQAMLDAAQMALFEVGGDRLELLPRDSGGTASTAATAAHSAIDDGAKLVLGPLLAAEVEAVKPIAQGADVPVVAFSTATQLAGSDTWLLGFDPRQEISRVVTYAQAHGRQRFATFAPTSAYGDIAVAALRDAAAVAGASLGPIVRYDPAANSLGPAVQAFAAGGADYDALLLPEGGARLKALAPLLPFYGIDPGQVKFLGTGLWAEPGLGTEPALQGAWYAAPDPAIRANFEARFKQLYGVAPPLLATLGYDATALAAVLARNGDFSAAALTTASGFSGLNGIFRLLPDGIVERGLAVLEVTPTGVSVIDPAPDTFAHATY
jgi:ABC-type branched-subunit amino acid transport system substrate-binding protein